MNESKALEVFESIINQALANGLFKSINDIKIACEALGALKANIEGRKDSNENNSVNK